jgi:DNA-binding transcriptional ArsR family regulator
MGAAMLNQMVQRSQRLDACFAALSDPTRRAILERLRKSEATMSVLAGPFDVSAPAVTKHVNVLEQAGLVARERAGREVHVRLVAKPMREASIWMARYRAFWTEGIDALEDLLEEGSER